MKVGTKEIGKLKMLALLNVVDCTFGWKINPYSAEKWIKSVCTKHRNIKDKANLGLSQE